MNTHDIELPTLPDDEVADAGAFMGAAQVMTAEAAQAYAIAAIEADRKRRDDLEAQLEKAVTERDDYHDMADQLAEQIAAITDQEIGEHSSGNNPWQNAMLAADEWIARDIRRLTDGVDRKRRGEPVAWPRVFGISRDMHPRCLVISLAAEPTDDHVRAIHDALSNAAPVSAPATEHATQACNLQPVAAQAQPDLIEQIAGQWDGCIYDAGGSGDIDIGGAIRAAARKLAQQPVSGADGLPGASSS